jgi:hypothetical protein
MFPLGFGHHSEARVLQRSQPSVRVGWAYMVFMPVLSASTYSGLMFDLVDGGDHLEQRATGFAVSNLSARQIYGARCRRGNVAKVSGR